MDPPAPPTTDSASDHSSDPPSKLRLMCSYGGHIIPRPHDKSLCYVGGDTRIVVTDRHVSLSDLTNRLSATLLSGKTFSLKYQLPSEDLDSLISVTTDEDLENMIEEYDRLTIPTSAGKKHPARIRLFLFTESKTQTHLENSVKSEEWFVGALNGSGRVDLAESESVNSLLGLDDVILGEKNGGGDVKEVTRKQDVHSVPDSPCLERSSSFESNSSLPSTVNLAPIRTHVVEQKAVAAAVVGIEEQKQEDRGFFVTAPPATAMVPPLVADMVSPDSVSSENSITNQFSRQRNMVYQDPTPQFQYQIQNQNYNTSSNRAPPPPNPVDPKQSGPNPSYIYPSQFDQQIHQLNPQYQQPHYIQPGSQYPPQGPVPAPTYYIVYSPQQQYPSSYISARTPQSYNIQPSYAPSMGSSQNPQQLMGSSQNPQQVMGSSQNTQQFIGYSQIHHQSQSNAPSSISGMGNLAYTQPMAPQIHQQSQLNVPSLISGTGNLAYTQAMPPQIHQQSQSNVPSSISGMGKFSYTQPMTPQMTAQYQNAPPVLSEALAQVPSESLKQQNKAPQL